MKMRTRVISIASHVALLLVLAGSGWSAAAAQTAGVVNARASTDDASAHVEPSVAVNPANPLNLLSATQLITGPDDVTKIGATVSFDGGKTWTDNGPLTFPAGANTGDDVTVNFDSAGHGFVTAMVTEQDANGMSRTDRGISV